MKAIHRPSIYQSKALLLIKQLLIYLLEHAVVQYVRVHQVFRLYQISELVSHEGVGDLVFDFGEFELLRVLGRIGDWVLGRILSPIVGLSSLIICILKMFVFQSLVEAVIHIFIC